MSESRSWEGRTGDWIGVSPASAETYTPAPQEVLKLGPSYLHSILKSMYNARVSC